MVTWLYPSPHVSQFNLSIDTIELLCTVRELPYFLEISTHLKIPPPSKCRRSICQLIPINTALEILQHGKGSTAISICARAFYVHTTRLIEAVYICMRVRVDLCRCHPQNLAAIKLSPHMCMPPPRKAIADGYCFARRGGGGGIYM